MTGIHKDSRSMSDSNLLKFNTIDSTKADEWKKANGIGSLAKSTLDLAATLGYDFQRSTRTARFSKSDRSKIDRQTQDIAIIGMACRVPGANTLHEFWLNLINGIDVSKEVTVADLEKAGLNTELLNQPNYVARSLSLDHLDCFDAPFFGYYPKEAAGMDPQHRVLLEVAYATVRKCRL